MEKKLRVGSFDGQHDGALGEFGGRARWTCLLKNRKPPRVIETSLQTQRENHEGTFGASGKGGEKKPLSSSLQRGHQKKQKKKGRESELWLFSPTGWGANKGKKKEPVVKMAGINGKGSSEVGQ